ncbi:MAG TPA: flagellar hook-basal body complex protein, partial [Pseudothauera hydrothermalis]|nr:flagellar hook-basal body complex protein [Pseudothauera hydrothermalis]
NVVFTDTGLLDPLSPALTPFTRTAAALNNGAADLTFPIDLSKLTQFGSPFSITDIRQDGFSSGQVAGYSISRDGIIQGRYTNGQTRDLGQVALVTFRSPNGLVSLGNNMWAASPESGPPVPGRPGTGLNGVISAGQVEDSNVDLTQELVQLIIQQRNYQANAQSIRTQDQILQTLVNLR